MFASIFIDKNAFWEGEAPAEPFTAAKTLAIARERWAAAEEGSAGASPSRNTQAGDRKDV